MEQQQQQHTEKAAPQSDVLETPIWVFALRIAQIVLSLIIIGLAGTLMHDLYLDEYGLAVATTIITWVIVAYIVLAEKVHSLRKAYHVLAVLSLDAFLVIMWLATFAATAARRAQFTVKVNVDGCNDDGSAINSKTCWFKRDLDKRAILFKSGQAMMSAIAGLGALVWLLFIATFVWTLLMFLRGHKQGRFQIGGGSKNTYQMEPKTEQAAPMMQEQQQQQQNQHQYSQQQPIQPQPTGPYEQQNMHQQPAGQYQQAPLGQHPPQDAYQQTAYQSPVQSYAQEPAAYNQYSQQTPAYQQHVQQGSELSGSSPPPQQHYSTPSPIPASSPPPQQYHQQ